MRWKAIMYDAGCKENRKVEKYGLTTLHSLKHVKELSAFETELITVVKDIKFRNVRRDFQTTRQEGIRLIHNSKKKLLTCSDLQKRNTTSYYETQLLGNIKRQTHELR